MQLVDSTPNQLAAKPRDRGLVATLVYLFEQVIPDAFVLSIGLTILVIALALAFAPNNSIPTILTSWYNGVFAILTYAAQMILMLAAGFAVADAAIVRRGLTRLSSRVRTPAHAVVLLFPLIALAAWLNWALGMILAAFLAREIGKRTKVDFAWLVAANYSAWSICNSGLSSPIPLSQASHGNVLNLTEKATGHVLPLTQTILAPFVLIPTVLIVVAMTVIFVLIHPKPEDTQVFSEAPLPPVEESHGRDARSPASWAERSFVGTALLLLVGVAYLAMTWSTKGFELDINTTILIFLLIGLVLQGSPIAYANAIREASSHTGSMLLQYPVYGGIMGIMTVTGLAAVIAKMFVVVASPATLPIWSFLSSVIITFFVPSAGGHWAVQGPFVLPAAINLHASIPHTAMGVAMAENVSNMLQPFWVAPVAAMAGIKLQRVMGYTAVTFAVSLVTYGGALLLAS